MDTTTYSIAPDAHGEPTLWRGTGSDPYGDVVATRHELDRMDPVLWPTVVAGLHADNPTAPEPVVWRVTGVPDGIDPDDIGALYRLHGGQWQMYVEDEDTPVYSGWYTSTWPSCEGMVGLGYQFARVEMETVSDVCPLGIDCDDPECDLRHDTGLDEVDDGPEGIEWQGAGSDVR